MALTDGPKSTDICNFDSLGLIPLHRDCTNPHAIRKYKRVSLFSHLGGGVLKFLIFESPIGEKSVLVWFLLISLIVSEAQHLPICLRAISISSSEDYPFMSFTCSR